MAMPDVGRVVLVDADELKRVAVKRREGGKQQRYSNVISVSSVFTSSPSLTYRVFTTPAIGAFTWLSIFIASTISNRSPFFTDWPCLASTLITLPGMEAATAPGPIGRGRPGFFSPPTSGASGAPVSTSTSGSRETSSSRSLTLMEYGFLSSVLRPEAGTLMG